MFCGLPSGPVVRNLPAMQETQEMRVRSLGPKDPLEEGMATHSSILAGKIPWTEEPGRLQSSGLQMQATVHWVTKSQTRLKQLSAKVFYSVYPFICR